MKLSGVLRCYFRETWHYGVIPWRLMAVRIARLPTIVAAKVYNAPIFWEEVVIVEHNHPMPPMFCWPRVGRWQ
jgi:hypothetical protein